MTTDDGRPTTAVAGPSGGGQRSTVGGRVEGTWTLDPAERRVLALLEEQAGAPVAMPDLAAAAGLSTRKLQTVIHQLVALHGVAICSCSRPGANGYWIPTSPEQVAAGMADLTHRIRQLAERARALDAAGTREFTRQLALEMAGADRMGA